MQFSCSSLPRPPRTEKKKGAFGLKSWREFFAAISFFCVLELYTSRLSETRESSLMGNRKVGMRASWPNPNQTDLAWLRRPLAKPCPDGGGGRGRRPRRRRRRCCRAPQWRRPWRCRSLSSGSWRLEKEEEERNELWRPPPDNKTSTGIRESISHLCPFFCGKVKVSLPSPPPFFTTGCARRKCRLVGNRYSRLCLQEHPGENVGRTGVFLRPTNTGVTRATPTTMPLVVISDGVKIWVALRCSKGSFFSPC